MVNIFQNLTNPLEKIAVNQVNNTINKAEQALIGNIGNALAKIGLGSPSRNQYLASLGDSIMSGIASEFFGTFNGEINRLTRQGIVRNTGFAKTDSPEKILTSDSVVDAGALQYPPDLTKYYIGFQFKKYERPNPATPIKYTPGVAIALPLPRDLVESFDVSYDSGLNTGIWGAAFNALGQKDTLSVFGASAGAAGYLLSTAASAIDEGLLASVQQSLGAISNPNIGVTFRGPTLRSHKFTWTFAPNNEEETNEIRKIIRAFKANSLASVLADTTAILQFPNLCQVTLYPWGQTQDNDSNMYTFKTCIVENVTVNYAPESIALVNTKDGLGAPAFIQLSLSLKEIEYFTSGDFGLPSKTTASVVHSKLDDTVKQFGGDAKTIYNTYSKYIPGIPGSTPAETTTSPPSAPGAPAGTPAYNPYISQGF